MNEYLSPGRDQMPGRELETGAGGAMRAHGKRCACATKKQPRTRILNMTDRVAFLLTFGVLAVSLPAFGAEYVKPQPEMTHTEHVDFPFGGVIRLEADGDLFVEGWDQMEVETTVTKSMRYKYESAQSQSAAQRMESLRVVTERRSPTELKISIVLPSRHGNWSPPLPPTTKAGVTLEYHLRVPRNSRLVIHQGVGDVLVRGVTGDIEAACRMGDIMLWLSGTRTYSIDARSRAGAVSSDFSGVTRSYFLFGQTFTNLNPAPSQRLHLRVAFGGITIKPILPESETPPSPASAK
jgi:hypothetical protein